MILGGFAGLYEENGVVFLWKIEWISFHGSGDGVMLCEFNMEWKMGFAKEFKQFGITHTF